MNKEKRKVIYSYVPPANKILNKAIFEEMRNSVLSQ